MLIIDEAQNLSADVLEQLRLLTNLETNERKLLQIVLIGQPELRAMLERPQLEQLAQRVIARFHLDALTEAESAQYIGHRLGVAGHVGPLPFEAKALQRIHRRAHGVPRRLNLLCGRALLGAWANGLHRVNAVMVDKAAAEVFGQDAVGAGAARQAGRPAVYALGGLALLGAWANGLHRVNAVMVDKAAAEVFGQDAVGAGAARQAGRPAVYALGGLALLAGAALTGFVLGRSPPQQALAAPRLAASASALLAASRAGVSAPGALAPGVAASGVAVSAAPLAGVAPSGVGAVAASAALAGASSALGAAPAANPAEEIQALLAQLPGDLNVAWRELAPVWKLPATGADPCQSVSVQPFQCYRSASLSVLRLRQLGRPGILTLQADGGAPVYAVLTGLSDQSATLQIAGRPHSVRLVSLVALWRGDFATFWRPPSGYSPGLRGEGAGPALAQLGRQLALLDGAPPPAVAAPPVLDAALRERIQAFQRAQGLEPDGLPGPMTFMQIDSATDASVPRLQTNLR